ncbi:MAG: hypothetical protein ACO3K7_01250 [Candidatus Marinamargulisbacteria bacterium]
MDSQKNRDSEIRKIIDPKSGFSLYLRKFSDSRISQVSTDDTFKIPDPSKIHAPKTDASSAEHL